MFRNNYDNLQSRLKGIDACSNEIGCRPENLATEFRFLRNYDSPLGEKWNRNISEIRKNLRVTYHVGEDFLDVCDGLRAVDEAVEFLELGNGDRIGHGLVLGLDSGTYYKIRCNNIF